MSHSVYPDKSWYFNKNIKTDVGATCMKTTFPPESKQSFLKYIVAAAFAP